MLITICEYFFLHFIISSSSEKNRYFWESLQSTRYAPSICVCDGKNVHRKCIEYERFMMIKFLAWRKRRVWLQQQIHAIEWKLSFILKFYRSLERRLRFNPVEKGTIHHIQADLLLISFLPSDSFILFPVAAYYYMFNLPHTTCFTNVDVVKIVGAPISQHVLYNQIYTLTSSVLQVIHFLFSKILLIVYDVKSRNSADESAALYAIYVNNSTKYVLNSPAILFLLIEINYNNTQFSQSSIRHWVAEKNHIQLSVNRKEICYFPCSDLICDFALALRGEKKKKSAALAIVCWWILHVSTMFLLEKQLSDHSRLFVCLYFLKGLAAINERSGELKWAFEFATRIPIHRE